MKCLDPSCMLLMLFGTYGNECTLHHLQSCLDSLQSVAQSTDIVLASTEDELLSVCSILKESVLCVDDHMKLCFTPTQRKVFNHVVEGARQFLIELCVPGSIQQAYLKYSPCYKNVSLLENKCALMYQHLIQLSEKVDERNNVDDGVREYCCAFNSFVQCKRLHVQQDCGQQSAEFLQRHLDRISNSLIHEHCAHYMYAADSCSKSSIDIGSLPLIFLTAAIVYLTEFVATIKSLVLFSLKKD